MGKYTFKSYIAIKYHKQTYIIYIKWKTKLTQIINEINNYKNKFEMTTFKDLKINFTIIIILYII